MLDWFGKSTPDKIDLGDVGDRETDSDEVFKIWVSRRGTYHLRTHSYGEYYGNTWPEAKEYDDDWRFGFFVYLRALGPGFGNPLSGN